ncbi:hypothetical protein [Haloplanus salinarum]|uniref:hypothetical protein n=1 Tax=Haloplanus salinarum TaxID=1912324 RepID=UPI00214BA21C|nr:hypothetical protein [Haloplanus salinarum]
MVARLDRVVRLYGRYGPTRLPLGDRQDVGAGYSMAVGVLAGGIVFAPVSTLVSGTVGSAGVILSAIPVYLATGFVVGALTWRSLPSSVPYYSAVAALVTVAGNYLAGTAVWLLLAPVYGYEFLNPYGGVDPPTSLTEFLGAFFELYPDTILVVVVWTIWIAVPLSLFFSYVYGRSLSGE